MKNLFLIITFCYAITSYAQKPTGTPLGYKLNNIKSIHEYILPGFDVQTLQQEDELNKNNKAYFRFGYNYHTNITPYQNGTWTTLSNGDRLWQLVISCPNARSINLGFSNYQLPQGSRLFVYNTTHTQQSGAHTPESSNFKDQLFGTTLIQGDKVIVEYYEPKTSIGKNPFTINRVTHRYRPLSFDNDMLKNTSDLGESGSCNINVNCPEASFAVNQKRSSVMLVSNGNGFCSGALISDVPHSGTPYILSADHCGSMDGSTVFWFNWEAPSCNNPASAPPADAVTGATMRANDANSDFALAELNSIPPLSYNVFYSGWSNSSTPADSAFCIHHPSGDITKFSKTSSPNITGTPFWETGLWTLGITEPGSSGSPLYDQNLRIVGQLQGGPSACGVASNDLIDYYGRFDVSWTGSGTPQTRLSDWLDPNNTGVLTEDGYSAVTPTIAIDAQVLALQSTICNANLTITTGLRNVGLSNLTSAIFTFSLDGIPVHTTTWMGNISSYQTGYVNYNLNSVSAGAHTIAVQITSPNNGVDGNTSDNSTAFAFTITIPTSINGPINENFETLPFPAANWSISNPDNAVTWQRETSVGGFGNSSNCVKLDNYSLNFTDEEDGYVTPILNLNNITQPTLQFDVAYKFVSNFYSDTLLVKASLDCGYTWATIYKKGGTTLASTAGQSSNEFKPTSTEWRTESISLNPYANSNQLKLALVNKSGYGNHIYIDNINIGEPTVGVEELDGDNLILSPNPAQDVLAINGNLLNHKLVSATVLNVLGKEISQHSIENQTTLINIGSLSNGIYFVKITTASGIQIIKKIIKE